MIPLKLLIFTLATAVPVLSIEVSESYPETNEKSGLDGTKNLTSDLLEQLHVSVFFDNVKLGHLPTGFVKSEFLTDLSFEGSQIESISPSAFISVPRLSHLNLANNLLQNIDLSQFSMVQSLKTLILRGNCKTEKKLVDGGNLVKLVDEQPIEEWGSSEMREHSGFWIHERTTDSYTSTEPSRFKVISIPCEVNLSAQLPSLVKLYLDNNNLKKLKFAEGMSLPLLTHLYISGNQLDIDNDVISNLNEFAPSLSDLHLERSNINEFDASQLPKVTSFYLDGNMISSVCNEYCEPLSLKLKGARNLETLSVSQNQISKMESDSFNYTINLVTLDLSKNRISEIREGTFDKLHMLRYLSLEYNNIVEPNAAHAFRSLINLENLFLGNNYISTIAEGAFDNLVSLKSLSLNNNRIFGIQSGTFSKLIGLETLSLAGNRLSEIPDESMPTSGSLITLNLDKNAFGTTGQISLTNLPNLLVLSLEDNPLTTMRFDWHSIPSTNLTIILGNTCQNYPGSDDDDDDDR